jgi:hypothetical protein
MIVRIWWAPGLTFLPFKRFKSYTPLDLSGSRKIASGGGKIA